MKAQQQLPRNALVWIVGAQFLLLMPHLTRIPLWVVAVYLVTAFWRMMVYQGRWSFPGRLPRVVMALTCFGGVLYSYGTLLGLEPTVSLLLAAFALKLVELSERKDAYLLVFLGYFVCVTEFLFSQALGVTFYMFLCVVVLTCALVALHQHQEHQFTLSSFRRAGVMLAQSFPLMLVLFFVFPRIGPLWSVPLKSHAAKSGVSDFMRPGDISELSLSDELAFRVRFQGEIPEQKELYWRGLVFSSLEGGSWRALKWEDIPAGERRPAKPESLGERQLQYGVVLEPTQQNWLYALRYASSPDGGVISSNDYRLYTPVELQDQRYYRADSWPDAKLETELSSWRRRIETSLPAQGNAKTRELARQIYREVGEDNQLFVEEVLRLFREQSFYYTLRPPALNEEDAMDDFMFNTRRGFCEHYAAVFVYMSRAAGVPARVIAGYQGGEINPVNSTVAVHQFDAHAWAEAWYDGEGWVRVDPTAAIAPQRVESGLEQAMQEEGSFLESSPLSLMRYRNVAWLNRIRLQIDALNYRWQLFVLEYDSDNQYELLNEMLGKVTPARVAALLTGVWVVVLLGVGLSLMTRRKPVNADPATRLYRRFCRKLDAVNLQREQFEAPADYAERIAKQRPDLADDISAITVLYSDIAYCGAEKEGALEQLKQLIARFRPRRQRQALSS